jgi:hypothetical protein
MFVFYKNISSIYMSVASYGGTLCKQIEVFYTTPSVIISAMGQVVEATNETYTDGGDQELLDEAILLDANAKALRDDTQALIQKKNEFKSDYLSALALLQSVTGQYNSLLVQYQNALATFGTPPTRSIVSKIGYSNGSLNSGINLLNSSIAQFGDTSQGFCNPVLLGEATLDAGSYNVYLNFTASGVNDAAQFPVSGERLAQNTLAFSVTTPNYLVVDGANLNLCSFTEFNQTNDENTQGVLCSLTGTTQFTITTQTQVQYWIMIMRDQNYTINTPNFVSPNLYERPSNGSLPSMDIVLNNNAVVVVKMG